jgi:hypothetical protein
MTIEAGLPDALLPKTLKFIVIPKRFKRESTLLNANKPYPQLLTCRGGLESNRPDRCQQ